MLTDIFRFIFDMATDPLSLPINPLYEWAILGVIGIFAYAIAVRLVGEHLPLDNPLSDFHCCLVCYLHGNSGRSMGSRTLGNACLHSRCVGFSDYHCIHNI